MFARLLKMQIETQRIDEAAMLFEESVVPLCKTQKGYKGAHFLADRKTGACIPITLWETEEDMLSNERSRFFQEQVSKFVGYFTAPPVRESFELLFEDRR